MIDVLTDVWAREDINTLVDELIVNVASDVVTDTLTAIVVGVDMLGGMEIIVLATALIRWGFAVLPISYTAGVLADIIVVVLIDTLADVIVGVVPSIGGNMLAGVNDIVLSAVMTGARLEVLALGEALVLLC